MFAGLCTHCIEDMLRSCSVLAHRQRVRCGGCTQEAEEVRERGSGLRDRDCCPEICHCGLFCADMTGSYPAHPTQLRQCAERGREL